jgi:hypothetical protein
MREHDVNKLDNFIAGWYHDDVAMCDKLIEYHKTNPTNPGVTNKGLEKHIKDSEDCIIHDGGTVREYCRWMSASMIQYREKYPYCNMYAPFMPIEPVSVQYYKPGGGYFEYHTERVNATMPNASRHLVFMTYLNDVTDGGETEWLHQKIKIKPEKGLTVIWPADWTFTHRGCVSMTQEKYIVTGWVNYIVVKAA